MREANLRRKTADNHTREKIDGFRQNRYLRSTNPLPFYDREIPWNALHTVNGGLHRHA